MNKLLSLFLCLVFAPSLPAYIVSEGEKEREEALQQSQIGDWVEYELAIQSKIPGAKALEEPFNKVKNHRRVTVMKKDAKSVTLKIELISEKETQTKEEVVVFGQPKKDDSSKQGLQEAEGWGPLRVGNADYECHWTEEAFTTKVAGNQRVQIMQKVWSSKDVPLDGVVKRTFTSNSETTQSGSTTMLGSTTTTTDLLVASGRAQAEPRSE